MKLLLLIVGALITLAGVVLIVRPAVLFDLLRTYQNSRVLYALAIVVRALLGVALLLVAPTTPFPLALTALGWLAIGAAVFIAAVGPTRFSKLMTGVLNLATTWGRAAGVFTVLFGGFLIYALL
ncbi:MAG: hypothetical protein KJP03_02850 [Gammaproteobacteria bacterium]|nr:hypothetical protein [Gammaproteobacteria bacterium]